MAGLEGHTPHSMGPASSEPSGTLLAEDRRGSDQVSITVGPQQHGPVSPDHGAAGGHGVDFWTEGASGSAGDAPSGTADTPFG